MNKELIQKARQANLAEYLTSKGIQLKREGQRHRHTQHDSLIFTKNSYYWNSRQEKGNSIDYLVRHMEMSFIDAVLALTATSELSHTPDITPSKGFMLDSETLNPNCQQAKTYLNKERHIESNIIDYLVQNRLLLQERKTNNIVFPMYDESNICVGAELQGVTKKRFKGIMEGSKYGYGFNVRFSNDGTFGYALFFESAVDLISFVEYKKNYENKSLDKCILVSMAGLKTNIVKHTLKSFNGDLKIVLCVDNDDAGQLFKSDIEGIQANYIDCAPNEKYKDWNEQLTAIKSHSIPIQRLIVRGIAGNNNENSSEPTQKATILHSKNHHK